MTDCKNCGHHYEGDFCSSCGQKNISSGITLKETLSDWLSFNFSIDGPLRYTFRMLITSPGVVMRDFIGGRRKAYYKPVQMFIVCTLVFITLQVMTGYNPINVTRSSPGAGSEAIEKFLLVARDVYMEYINLLLIFFVFGIAIIAHIFFGKRYRFAELLVPGFYIVSVYILFGIVDIVSSFFIEPIVEVKFFVAIAYVIYVFGSFLQSWSVLRIIQYLVIGLVSIVLYTVAGFAVSALIAALRV